MVRAGDMCPAPPKYHAPIASDANNVRGFPRDAFMDMGMDEAVAKPENNGLPRNWSAMMMGMMTLVRVLPAELYDLVMNDIQRGYVAAPAPDRLRPRRGEVHRGHRRVLPDPVNLDAGVDQPQPVPADMG